MTDFNERTHLAMMNPKVGDHFHEMHHFHVYVLDVNPNKVVMIEASSPCTFPNDGDVHILTHEEFRKRFSYQSPNLKDKYWVTFYKNENISSWNPYRNNYDDEVLKNSNVYWEDPLSYHMFE